MTEFSEFWAMYPRKVGKRDAEKAWRRMAENERAAAIQALPAHADRWDDKAYIPHPSTWLNGARWEDEIEDVRPEPKALGAWWTTHEGVEKRARELGLSAKPGEGWVQFKERVIAVDKTNRMLRAV